MRVRSLGMMVGTGVTVLAVGVFAAVTDFDPPIKPATASVTPTEPPTAAPTPYAPQSWTEDGLPPVMYLWRDRYGGKLIHLPTFDGGDNGVHRECWMVAGDTALVMCPDGYASTS